MILPPEFVIADEFHTTTILRQIEHHGRVERQISVRAMKVDYIPPSLQIILREHRRFTNTP
jgi:hypothetical protein